MKLQPRFHTLLGLLGLALTAACGGPEAQLSEDTSAVLSSNCQELCRRYKSMERHTSSTQLGSVGRAFVGSANEGVQIAEGHLITAGQASNSNRACWQGNRAVSSHWQQVQPRSDIYRDLSRGARNALLNQCAQDFGL